MGEKEGRGERRTPVKSTTPPPPQTQKKSSVVSRKGKKEQGRVRNDSVCIVIYEEEREERVKVERERAQGDMGSIAQ